MADAREVTAAIAALLGEIDTLAPEIDREQAGRCLSEYVEGLGLEKSSIRWVPDLRTLRDERVWPAKGAGRWRSFSARHALLCRENDSGESFWVPATRAIALAQLDSTVSFAGLGVSRYVRAVKHAVRDLVFLCTSAAAGRVDVRRIEAFVPLAEAARAGLFAFAVGRAGELVCVPRPRLRLDEAGRLHDWNGRPAVEWEEGRSLWFWRGVQMTESVGRDPDALTPVRIAGWANAERRRVAIERMGLGWFISGLGGAVVQQDDFGRLWRTERDVDGDSYVAVEVVNATAEPDGTFRRYFLRVPPSVSTARAAVAWTFGFDNVSDYALAAAS